MWHHVLTLSAIIIWNRSHKKCKINIQKLAWLFHFSTIRQVHDFSSPRWWICRTSTDGSPIDAKKQVIFRSHSHPPCFFPASCDAVAPAGVVHELSVADEASELQLQLRPGGGASLAGSAATSPAASPRAPRKDFSILKSGGTFRARHPPAVTFNVENEEDSDDDGQITFSVRPHRTQTAHYRAPQPAVSSSPRGEPPALRSRPSSLLVAAEDAPDAHLYVRSKSVEDSTKTGSPVVDLKRKNLRKTVEILRKVSSAERLSRLKDKIMRGSSGSRDRSPAREEGSDDESAPLVTSAPSSPAANLSRGSGSSATSQSPSPQALGVEIGDRSQQDASAASDVSPRSDITELESPRTADFDVLPQSKSDEERGGGCARVERADSGGSVSNMVEPYNMRLLSRGASDARYLWRQDALESGPPWPWDEPDSAVWHEIRFRFPETPV